MLSPLLLALAPSAPSSLPQEVAERAVDPESGHTYLRTAQHLTVHDALALARSAGGTLASIGTAYEETFLLENFGASEGYWIGLEYPRETWDSGEPIAFTHWARGEPTGGAAEPFTLFNWGEPGAWGDTAGEAGTDLYRALIELGPGAELQALPELPHVRRENRGVLLCMIQGLEGRDLASPRLPNLNGLWKGSGWTSDAGTDPSGDPLAGLGMLVWGVGSGKSLLASGGRNQAPAGIENLLTRLERNHPEIQTAALFDDPALTGILVDGRVDLRASSASPRRGGSTQPLEEALRMATPLCVLAAWTDLRPPGSAEVKENERARALAAIDAELGNLLTGLRARPAFAAEDWWIAVAGVAPAGEKGKGSRPDLRAESAAPLLIVAPDVRPHEILGEVSLADVLPSAMARLGIEPRPAWFLDGRAIVLEVPAEYGKNRISNGGAEQSYSSVASTAPLVQGWRQLQPFRVGAWSSAMSAGDPGPPQRGSRHFQGGAGASSRMEQTIDLGAHASDVDAGKVRYRLSGWFGSRKRVQATIECSLEFLGEQGKALGRATLGPLGTEERRERRPSAGAADDAPPTGLVELATSGKVPRRTRAARVVLRAEGGVEALLADELSLVLELE